MVKRNPYLTSEPKSPIKAERESESRYKAYHDYRTSQTSDEYGRMKRANSSEKSKVGERARYQN